MIDKRVIRGYMCPQWHYLRVTLPATSEVVVPASAFENSTMFKERLYNLALTSPLPKVQEADPPGPWHRHITIELGKSGCSDQNLVRGSVSALFTTPYHKRQKFGAYNMGYDCKLPSGYVLPRDCRLEVAYENLSSIVSSPITDMPELTFVAFGCTINDDGSRGDPVVLAGEGDDTLTTGQKLIRSSDLRNKGRREILIERLVFQGMDINTEAEAKDESGTLVGWRVNPDVGTQWMLTGDCIPVGNLAPMARSDQIGDRGPRVYFYPVDTWLYPKQSLGIKFINESAYNNVVYISLFGELEVA